MKKNKIRYLLTSFFVFLLLGGSLFYVVKYHIGADIEANTLTNHVTITYTDKDQKNITFYETSSTQKVLIPQIVLDPKLNKRHIDGKVAIRSLNNVNLDEVTVSFDEANKSFLDWTVVSTIDSAQKYNLILKIPGYLGKRINAVGLNSSAEISVSQLDAGNANGDSIIDIGDFSALMSSWGQSNVNSDFNGDNIINIGDFSALMSSWGKTES